MDKIYLGNKLESFEISEPFLPISRVILKVDSQNGYISGDDSGRTIEKTMPWATQAMADSILASLKGQVYKPYSGSGALLDPAAELGDALTVAGNYGILAGMSRQLDRMGISDISAPGADELEDEFPYTPKSQREVERVLGKAYSRISKTADQIRLDIIDVESAVSSLEIDLEGITQRVQDAEGNIGQLELTATGLSGRISDAEGGIAALEVSLGEISSALSTAEGNISSIAQTVGSISARVSSAEGNITTLQQTDKSLDASIKATNGNVTDLSATVDGISNRVSTAEGNITSVTQTANKINWLVKSGTSASNFTMTDRAISLVADSIDLTGYVTFSSLTEAGKTSINGANITTGKISADRIDADNLSVKAANITGTLAIGRLPNTVAQKSDIPTKLSAFTNDEGFQNASGVTTIIDGRITTGYIEALDISARKLKGEKIYLRDNDGKLVSTFTLNAADTADYKLDIEADALAIVTSPGNLYLAQGEGSCFIMILPGSIRTNGPIIPAEDDSDWLGSGSKRWTDIYAVNGTIQTSDREQKKDVRYGLTEYDRFFDALAPCTFRFIDGHERIHMGMIAQDIEEQMAAHGIDSMELAAFIKSPNEYGDGFDYGLRYGEFISLLIDQVQKLKKRVKDLEEAA